MCIKIIWTRLLILLDNCATAKKLVLSVFHEHKSSFSRNLNLFRHSRWSSWAPHNYLSYIQEVNRNRIYSGNCSDAQINIPTPFLSLSSFNKEVVKIFFRQWFSFKSNLYFIISTGWTNVRDTWSPAALSEHIEIQQTIRAGKVRQCQFDRRTWRAPWENADKCWHERYQSIRALKSSTIPSLEEIKSSGPSLTSYVPLAISRLFTLFHIPSLINQERGIGRSKSKALKVVEIKEKIRESSRKNPLQNHNLELDFFLQIINSMDMWVVPSKGHNFFFIIFYYTYKYKNIKYLLNNTLKKGHVFRFSNKNKPNNTEQRGRHVKRQ